MPSPFDSGPFTGKPDCSHQRLLQILLDNIPAQVYVMDLGGRILLASRSMELLFGVGSGGLEGRTRFDLMTAAEAEQRARLDQQAISTGQPAYAIDTLHRPDGSQMVFLAVKVPWSDENGVIQGVAGISTDVTKLHSAEQTLRESGAAHRLLFEMNPQAMWVYDTETLRFLAVNEAAVQRYGYSRDEFLKMTIESIRPEEDGARLHADLDATANELNDAGEWRHLTKSGECLDVEIRSHRLPWEGRPARLVVAFDITQRKKAAEDLDHFFNLSQDLLCIATREGRFLRLNPQWQRTLGYPVEEMIGRGFEEFAHPEDIAAAVAAANTMDDTTVLRDFVNRFRRRDGSYRILEWRSHARGDVIYSVARDITERRQAEDRLRDLSRAIEQSPASVIITDIEGRIEYVNPKFVSLTGYTLDDVRGQTPRVLKSGTTEPAVYEELWRTILAGETWEGEIENRKKGGTLYRERASISPVRDDQGRIRHFVAVKEDITEKRQLENQLTQSQKMEAVGLLAGGVAHDFNNLLTIINGYSELMMADQSLPEPLRQRISTIFKAGLQAADLTRQLLLFGRTQPGSPVLLELGPLVTDLADFYRRVLPENIRLEIDAGDAPALVVAEPTLLQQVVMNLVLNARDAMPKGGRLQIRIGRKHLASVSRQAVLFPGVQPGPFVVLEVSDNGEGMTENVISRIYDPFFTTKPAGRGTGLGLTTVFGIVRQAGGCIEAQSRPGEGSTFRVLLPDAGDAGPDTPESVPAEQTLPGGEETLLLVEDSPEVREFTAGALRGLGYHVLAADTGEQAITVASQHRGPLDLLVSDVMLPGIDGPEAAGIIRRLFPRIRTLFASGYVATDPSLESLRQPGSHFIAKPFTVAGLATAVRACLDSASPAPRILLVDPEQDSRYVLATYLQEAGYHVTICANHREALVQCKDDSAFDLIVADAEALEDGSLAACVPVRTGGAPVPLIPVTINGCAPGARPALSKPVSRSQLLQAVRGAIGPPPNHSA